MSTKCDPVNTPVGHDSTSGFIIIMIVPGTGEKNDDLPVTHTDDPPIAMTNPVGALVTLAFGGPVVDGTLTGT